MKDLLPLFAVTLAVAYGLVPAPASYDAESIGLMLIGYFAVYAVLLFAIPGVAMDLAGRMSRYGNIPTAMVGSAYTLPIAGLTFFITQRLCLANHCSDSGAMVFAGLATALVLFGAIDNFSAPIREKLALARHRAGI